MNKYDQLLGPAEPERNKYDDLLDGEQAAQRASLRAAGLQAAAGVAPDVAARSLALGQRLGLPADVVERNLPQLEAENELNEYDRLLTESPKLADWLSEPTNAKLARDDRGTLAQLESFLQAAYVDPNRGLLSGPVSYAGSIVSGTGALVGSVNRLQSNAVQGLVGDSAIGDIMREFFAPGEFVAGAVESGLKTAGKPIKDAGKAIAPPVERQNLATDVMTGVGQLAGQIAQAYLAPWSLLPSLAASGADQQAERVEAAGKAGTASGDTAVVVGAGVTAALEKFGITKLLERVPPKIKNDLMRKIADISIAGGIEAVQELIEGVLHNVTTRMLVDKETPILEGLDRETAAAGGAGALARSLIVTAIPGKQRAQARDEAQQLDALAKLVGQSKLLQRSPDKLQELLGRLTADGKDTVYVPVELFQSALGESAAEVARAAMGDPSALYEAQLTGGDVAIPLAAYLTRIAPEHHAKLAKGARLTPGSLTPQEAEQAEGEQQRIIDDFLASVDPQQAPDERIVEDVRGQLLATGMDPSSVDKNAQLVGAFFRTLGQRAGMDPFELFQQYGLRITRELPAVLRGDKGLDTALDPLLDRLRSGDLPKIKTGPSLADFARGMGVNDDRGDLRGMDPDKALKPFQRRMLRDDGMTLDDVASAAVEAGYFPGVEVGDLHLPDFIAAIDADLRGNPLFRPQDVDEDARALHRSLDELSEYLRDIGVDPRTADNATIKAAMRGQQADPGATGELNQPGAKSPRGRITMRDGRQFNIELLKGADPSTFLHETGHFFLEVFADIAKRPDASEQIRADWQALVAWTGGAVDGVGPWSLSVEQHEQFARGFEAYLREGTAPTVGMQTMFARFRAWLVGVYRQLRDLNVTLTDDVRRVMDRLIATDDEIKAAEARQGYEPLFTDAKRAGMTEAQFTAYEKLLRDAHVETQERLTRDAMRELTREQRAWWDARRGQVRAEVEEAVNAQPRFMALAYLQTGKQPDGSDLPAGVHAVKLDAAAIEQAYGRASRKPGEGSTIANALLALGVYRRKGGVAPDVVAAMFGYSSGDEMIGELVNAPNKTALIEADTDARMRDQFGDMLTDGTLPERAMHAAHGKRRLVALDAELRTLAKLAGQPAPTMQQLTGAAERIIAGKRARDVQPHSYLRGERQARRAALKAASGGKWAEALQQQRTAALNAALYSAAKRAEEDIDTAQQLGQEYSARPMRAKLGKAGGGYLEQIDALLDRFEFRRIPLRRVDSMESLRAWVAKQEADGLQVDVPPEVLDEAMRTNYRNLTVEQLRGVSDTIKNIAHLAGLKNRLLASEDEREFSEHVDALVGSIESNHTVSPDPLDLAPSFATRFGNWLSEVDSWLVKPEFLFRWLDGDVVNGPVARALFQPIADAEGAERDRMMASSLRLKEIFDGYDRGKLGSEKLFVPEAKNEKHKGSFTRASLLSVALNWGNSDNRDALMRGYGWTRADVDAILAKLTDQDWDAVEAIWEHVDSFWPDIAALQKDLTGLEPEKVAAEPFTLPNGRTLRGGYYPLKYDDRSQVVHERNEKAAVSELFGGNWARPATRKGHTIARVGSGGLPVKLDINVLTEHVYNVIHDLTHRRAVLDVARLIGNPSVRAAIEGTAGRAAYRKLKPWLQAVAADYQQAMSPIDALLRRARVGATVVNMGLKVTTAIVQPLGILQSAELLGARWATAGVTDFLRAPRTRLDFAMKRSALLRHRQQTFDRDVRDTLRTLVDGSRLDDARRSFFILTGMMDMAVSVPTWLGAYRKSMETLTPGDDAAAVDYADAIVRQTQGGGSTKDLALIQRGGETQRAFTMFYSYFNVLYNLFRRRASLTRSVRDVPAFAASMVYLWFLPAVLGEVIAGRGPDDDEAWAEWFAKKGAAMAFYPAMTVPVLRDIAGAFDQFGYDPSPAFDAFEVTTRVLGDVGNAVASPITGEDVEVERADVKDAVMAVGYWGALPSRQAWITGSYLYDYMTGEESPEDAAEFGRDLMFARPTK